MEFSVFKKISRSVLSFAVLVFLFLLGVGVVSSNGQGLELKDSLTKLTSTLSGTILLTKENTIVLRGEVTEESVARVAVSILEHPKKDVYLYITSPGGSVYAGMRLMNIIENSGKNVTCIADTAASMAFAILQSCQERYVLPQSIIMQHVAAYGLNGQEPNNYSMATFIREVTEKLDTQQAKRLGLSLEDFRKKTRDDWWMIGDNAVKYKAADKVVNVSCDSSLTKERHTEQVQALFWSFDVTFSGCPLVEGPIAVKPTRIGQPSSEAQSEYERYLNEFHVRNTIEKWLQSNKRPSFK
jgi:ATP-dependent Clp protease protease subunit